MSKLILIVALFFSVNSFGQDNANAYYANSGVSIYVKSADCFNPSVSSSTKQYLMIEIKNTSNKAIKVSFDKEMWYDNVCLTCNSNSNEYRASVIVSANSTIQGTCESSNKGLRIFSKMSQHDNVRKLTNYELKNISIENIK